jgi:predicted unusual protein kinase regulating ubiquinone biosynthesis (AarF/ABC1/UbiB family)
MALSTKLILSRSSLRLTIHHFDRRLMGTSLPMGRIQSYPSSRQPMISSKYSAMSPLHFRYNLQLRMYTVHLSSLSGSSHLFHVPLFLDRHIDMPRIRPDQQTDDTSSSSTTLWLACSPTSQTHNNTLLQRLLAWLRLCWRRLGRVWLVTSRSTEVLLRFSPLIVLSPLAVISSQLFHSSLVPDLAWKYTIQAIQSLGPVAIKFCQWAATRRDIFPPFLCDRLSVLHDRGYPHSDAWTKQILTEAFGDYQSKGLTLEEVIGCGSAAQVYRGTLTSTTTRKSGTANRQAHSSPPTSREVAIKVLHPGFQGSVDRDLLFIEIVADFFNSLPIEHIKMLNLPRVAEEFSVVMKDQADLTIEAKNLQQFRTNFYHNSEKREYQSSIVFPQPVDGWTSPQVMVEDYVGDAVPIASFLKDSSPRGMEIRKELAGPLLRAFLKMVFTDNYIHCDLHPVR